MVINHSPSSKTNYANATDILHPSKIIDQMIELRLQLAETQRQIQLLRPAFFEACTAQKECPIKRARAIITRRTTPGQWTYPPHITEQEDQLKQIKRHFQQTHEPTHGREVIWSVKLQMTHD